MLLNLLNNAIKFTDRGQVIFSIETLAGKSRTHLKLRFSVRDTGIGIAPEDLKNIFIAFHQVDNPITRAEGSGLGLTISQRLVNLMGGQLQVESHPDQGSRFWFDLELPLLAHPEAEATTQLEALLNPPPKTLQLPPPAVIRQLIELAQQHNILGLRELVKELETQTGYSDFHAQLQPYLSNYRFKPLVEWLKGLET